MASVEYMERTGLSRQQRELQLRQLWKSKEGQQRVLNLFWRTRRDDAPIRAGDDIFQAILDQEYGPSHDG